MPYIVVGVAMYLLYRYFSTQESTPAGQASYEGQGQPAANGGEPAPAAPGSPSAPSVVWQPLAEGSQLQPGSSYRAAAPPQNALVMAMIPSKLSSMGFTGVTIYKPGDAYPNDWPDSGGDMLRIAATLPAGAQPQTLSLNGVSVWRATLAQTTGQVLRRVAQGAARVAMHPGDVVRAAGVAYPSGFGAHNGLVKPR